MDSKVTLKHYDYDKREEVVDGETSTYTLAGSMTIGNVAAFLSEFLNRGGKNYREGVEIGKLLRSDHRTLQGSMVNFCLGIICGLADQKYTDPRNEQAIETANKIKSMLEKGELKYQCYI